MSGAHCHKLSCHQGDGRDESKGRDSWQWELAMRMFRGSTSLCDPVTRALSSNAGKIGWGNMDDQRMPSPCQATQTGPGCTVISYNEQLHFGKLHLERDPFGELGFINTMLSACTANMTGCMRVSGKLFWTRPLMMAPLDTCWVVKRLEWVCPKHNMSKRHRISHALTCMCDSLTFIHLHLIVRPLFRSFSLHLGVRLKIIRPLIQLHIFPPNFHVWLTTHVKQNQCFLRLRLFALRL